jgi:nucleoside-diphosphate-sugar epimerase
MKLVVLGGTGGLGYACALRAHALGHAVRVVARNPARVSFPDGIDVVRGDVSDAADLTRALDGQDSVIYCVNPHITTWKQHLLAHTSRALSACRAAGARLVFPANVWVFGRGDGTLVDEKRPPSPCAPLGSLRAQQEALLVGSGVRFARLRLPEFYGPNVVTLMGAPFRNALLGKRVPWIGSLDVSCEWVLMEDAAQAMVELAAADGIDGETFHLPGGGHSTPRQFFDAIAQAAGRALRVVRVPGAIIQLAALASPMVRVARDTRHLWTHPILLDGSKYRARFGGLPQTPYAEGIAKTLAWFRAHPDAQVMY